VSVRNSKRSEQRSNGNRRLVCRKRNNPGSGLWKRLGERMRSGVSKPLSRGLTRNLPNRGLRRKADAKRRSNNGKTMSIGGSSSKWEFKRVKESYERIIGYQ